MKLFLSFTTFAEVIVGMALIVAPEWIVSLLFSTTLVGAGGFVSAMIAGVAITSLALITWFSRKNTNNIGILITLLFYNLAIIAVVLEAKIVYDLAGLFLWLVVSVHAVLGVWGSIILIKQKIHLENRKEEFHS